MLIIGPLLALKSTALRKLRGRFSRPQVKLVINFFLILSLLTLLAFLFRSRHLIYVKQLSLNS